MDGFEFFTLDNLREKYDNDSSKQWLVEKIFSNNSTNILYGQPGSMKTFVALDMCLSIANGIPFHNHKVIQGDIVYVCFEGIETLYQRVNTWLLHHNINDNGHFKIFNMSKSLNNTTSINNFIQYIKTLEYKNIKLIVIDTLSRCSAGVDENSSSSMSRMIMELEYFKKEFDSSLLLIHHCGKHDESGIRGSSVLLGACDTVIRIRKKDKISFVVEKQKHGPPLEIFLHPQPFNDNIVLVSSSPISCIEKTSKIFNSELKTINSNELEKLRLKLANQFRVRIENIIPENIMKKLKNNSPKTIDELKTMLNKNAYFEEILEFYLKQQSKSKKNILNKIKVKPIEKINLKRLFTPNKLEKVIEIEKTNKIEIEKGIEIESNKIEIEKGIEIESNKIEIEKGIEIESNKIEIKPIEKVIEIEPIEKLKSLFLPIK